MDRPRHRRACRGQRPAPGRSLKKSGSEPYFQRRAAYGNRALTPIFFLLLRGDLDLEVVERARIDRLGEVVVEARLHRAAPVAFLSPAGERDQGHALAAGSADGARHLEA